MKNTFLISAFLLFISLNCFSQTNQKIDECWKDVRENLLFKTDIVLRLTDKLKKSNKIDKTELNKTSVNAQDLKIECEKNVLNEQAVKKVKIKNDNLNTFLVRTLVNLEFDIKLKSNEDVQFIMDELSVAENNIFGAIKKYNGVCISLNKDTLVYQIKSDSKSPQVEF